VTSRDRAGTLTRWRVAGTVLALSLFVIGAFVAAEWRSLWTWYSISSSFERIEDSPAGRAQYRHRVSGIVFVLIEGGEFQRGAARDERAAFPDERPQHGVRVSTFLMARHEVTQAEWRRASARRFFLTPGDDLPAHGVSWIECDEFCRRLGLSLPTEAEWEYACRADSTTAYSTGDDLTPDDARFGQLGTPARVESFPPNAFGLYELHGNVEEWCSDSYREDGYAVLARASQSSGIAIDPVARDAVDLRVVRGGSFQKTAEECRSARRSALPFSAAALDAGLRPVFRLPRAREPRSRRPRRARTGPRDRS
jgi:formylglycine-generating enzyme required for sulfatase activity